MKRSPRPTDPLTPFVRCRFEMLKTSDGSISGSLKVIEGKKKNKDKGKGGGKDASEWTWKEQVDLVKFTAKPIEQSLLRLETSELNDLAVECFVCLMRYMGDLPMPTDVSEVKCVYTVLMVSPMVCRFPTPTPERASGA